MRRLILLVVLIIASALTAEEVVVFRGVEAASHSSIGEEIGRIETGKETLEAIVEAYREKSWKAEPFYGPVERYIFKDSKGKLYAAHFEFRDGHPMIGKGERFAIMALTEVKGSKGKFHGSPYDGSSVYDEGMLKQLRELARKKPSKEAIDERKR